MAYTTITNITTRDARYTLKEGAGSDAIHNISVYSYPITELSTDQNIVGKGIALTLSGGNELVCQLIERLAEPLIGCEIEALMAEFGMVTRRLADHAQYRWLGPHKGMVHLALASLVNACFDLWAKTRGVPLWRLLLDLTSEQVVSLLDLSYLEDVLTTADAYAILEDARMTRSVREGILERGYPGYDTSIGWFNYSDNKVKDNIRKAIDAGFTAMKLKSAREIPNATFTAHTWYAKLQERTQL
jgi:L-fuconate dehydratase